MANYSVLCEYVDALMDKIQAGQEVIVEVRDLETFERKVVKALISQAPERLPDGSPLHIEGYDGNLREVPWAIKILEELDPDQLESIPLSDFRKHG